MKRMRPSPAPGFSLLELLVVIAIVAILAGLLLMMLRKGREQGHAAECINNLRTLAQANLQYVAEHDGRFCWAMDRANRKRWHGERRLLSEKFNPATGPLAPYLGRDPRIKACPALTAALKGDNSFEEGAGGYGYNAIYVGGSPANKWEGELLSNIENPAGTVMFTDTAMARKAGVQEYPFSEPWKWVNAAGRPGGSLHPSVHFRHSGHAHVAWCDGRVTAEKPSEFGGMTNYGGDCEKHQIGWFGPKDENGYWNPRRKSRE